MSLTVLEHALRGYTRVQAEPSDQRRAAVLALFDNHGEGLRLWFIRRAELGDDHSGQVALPGGHLNPQETPEKAALRECYEEIGVEPEAVELLGGLDDTVSIFGTVVSPLVGKLRYPVQPVADKSEVARVFSVLWSDLAQHKNYRLERWGQRKYPMHFWQLEGETIWGLTGFFIDRLIRMERDHET